VDLLEPEEMLVAYLKKGGVTAFASVGEELFASRPFLKAILESGQQTLGELWSEGSLHADA
jgi:hypothetical protein